MFPILMSSTEVLLFQGPWLRRLLNAYEDTPMDDGLENHCLIASTIMEYSVLHVQQKQYIYIYYI